ncbi:MAG: leucine-rich repeat domain-containing protein [Pseudobdellovibrionaceae bacterium]
MRFLLALVVITLMYSPPSQAVNAIRCQDQLYSLDYAMTFEHPPFGEFLQDKDLNTTPFLKGLLWSVIMTKTVSVLKDPFMQFLQNENNETDFSQPYVWQSNDLPFPSIEVPFAFLRGLPLKCKDPKKPSVTVYEVVRRTIRGKLVIFEYDRALMQELRKFPIQLSFLNMSTFIRPYTREDGARIMMTTFFHSRNSIFLDPEEIRKIANAYLVLPESDLCMRSPLVIAELQRELGLPCEEIKSEDLQQAKKMQITGTGRDTLPFTAHDFLGLSNLESLSISKTDRLINWFTPETLRDLTNLKHLKISYNDIDETPKNFMEGPYKLLTLDLSWNHIFELKRGAFRNVFVESTNEKVILDLSNNASQQPPRNGYVHAGAFDNCQAITTLSLRKMNILSLDSKVFDPLVRLESLDLAQNALRTIDTSLRSKSLRNIKFLDLSSNYFEKMREQDLALLISLETLGLAKNNLKDFPEFLLKHPTLKKLTFCGYRFTAEDYKRIGDLARATNSRVEITFCQ